MAAHEQILCKVIPLTIFYEAALLSEIKYTQLPHF